MEAVGGYLGDENERTEAAIGQKGLCGGEEGYWRKGCERERKRVRETESAVILMLALVLSK